MRRSGPEASTHAVSALTLACLLVLAGCSGLTAPAAPTPAETVTPAPVPSPPPTPPPDLAPGLTASGVTDAGALLAAHRSHLEGTSFRTNRTVSRTLPDGTVESRVVTRARFGADGRYHVVRTIDGALRERLGTVARVEQYATSERGFRRRVVDDGNATYATVAPADGEGPQPTALLPGPTAGREVLLALSAVNATVTDRERADGEWRYRLAGTGLRSVAALRSLTGRSDVASIANLSVTAVVTESGLVRSYAVTYADRREGGLVRVRRAGRIAGVGATDVSRPDWYATALVEG
ncbi:hypothetical protein N0B31_12660 [Salinirubellus salinus]|uniref:Lipoprotein n=1 Tax=Salinirubellus salinus TaxID=1364945 RepID=A0A9E7U9M7_9EURY|nr:hypothetical protein [Salinirubellus salinus]UWM52999.1 hypothetical protein N0B31_12660 [Salinirubellus salinus]